MLFICKWGRKMHRLTCCTSFCCLTTLKLRLWQNSSKFSCRCRWDQCRWRNRAQVGARRRSCPLCCFFSYWSVVEPSWDEQGSSSWVVFFYFGSVVGLMCVLWLMYDLLCIVWSGDCNPTLYPVLVHYMGLCEDDPSCDKNHNAVMPLSCTSTRGRYSHSVGVTSWYQSHPQLRCPLLDRISGVVESKTKNMVWVLGLYISESRILFTPQSPSSLWWGLLT